MFMDMIRAMKKDKNEISMKHGKKAKPQAKLPGTKPKAWLIKITFNVFKKIKLNLIIISGIENALTWKPLDFLYLQLKSICAILNSIFYLLLCIGPLHFIFTNDYMNRILYWVSWDIQRILDGSTQLLTP